MPFVRKAYRPSNTEMIKMVNAYGRQGTAKLLGISPSTVDNWLLDAKLGCVGTNKPPVSDSVHRKELEKIRAAEKRRPVHVYREANC